MKRLTPFFLFSLFVVEAMAVNSPRVAAVNTVRPAASGRVMAAQRAGVASKNQLSASVTLQSNTVTDDSAVASEVSVDQQKDMREKERMACMANNIGISNTFVWASRYSDTSNYATMVEDVEVPDNNVCFVKAALKSRDPKIDVSGVPAKYFEMGQVVTCGDWADYDSLKQQILDAKKKGRTLGTIASVVGAASIGVGAMELFGNELIGGKVEGQKALGEAEFMRSELLILQKEDAAKYTEFTEKLKQLGKACANQTENAYCKKYVPLYALMFPEGNNASN